jgi:hypothetical protein
MTYRTAGGFESPTSPDKDEIQVEADASARPAGGGAPPPDQRLLLYGSELLRCRPAAGTELW